MTSIMVCVYNRYNLCNSPSNSLKMKSATDVYEFLWENNTDIAYEMIRGDFLIQMQNGSLQAERDVNFTIQDMTYVLNVTDMLKKISANVTQPNDLKNFFKARYSSYKSFGKLMLQQYCFKVRTEKQRKKNFQLASEFIGDAL